MTQSASHLLNRSRFPRTFALWIFLAALSMGSTGCNTMGHRGAALVPTRYQVRTGPFLLYSNTPIPADSSAVRCLHELEADLGNRLGCRSRPDEDPVEIYVLNDRNAYTHFLKFYYPELPQRRAFFLAQGDRRVVYTFLSDRLEEDLRHESTHALIRGYYGDLPLWLDEGIAEYFENRPAPTDGPDEHLVKLTSDLESGWKPDLARLETLDGIHQMSPRDYRESWAWVSYLLEQKSSGRSPLIEYLNQRGPQSSRPHLSEQLAAQQIAPSALVAHLEHQESQSRAQRTEPRSIVMAASTGSRTQRTPTLKPDPVEENTPAVVRAQTPSRSGLLRRIGSWLGF